MELRVEVRAIPGNHAHRPPALFSLYLSPCSSSFYSREEKTPLAYYTVE